MPPLTIEKAHSLLKSRKDEELLQNLQSFYHECKGTREESDDFRLIELVCRLRVSPELIGSNELMASQKWIYENPGLLFSERALVELLLGNHIEALRILKEDSSGQLDATDYSRLGTALLLNGDYHGALSAYESAVELEGSRSDHYNNLGGALVRLGRFEEALTAYERCLAINPIHPQASESRISVATQLGKGDELIQELRDKLGDDPQEHGVRISLFRTLCKFKQEEEAIRMLSDHLVDYRELKIDCLAEAHKDKSFIAQLNYRLALADHFQENHKWVRALAVINQCVEMFTSPPTNILLRRAEILAELGCYKDSFSILDELEKDHTDLSDSIILMRSQILGLQGDEKQALDLLDTLKEDSPLNASSLQQRAHYLLSLGRIDECHQVLLRLSETNELAFAQLVQTKSYIPDETVYKRLKRIGDNPLLPTHLQEIVSFALSEAASKRGLYKESFAYLAKANSLCDNQVSYDPNSFSKRIDHIIECFSSGCFERWERLPASTPRPIFIVGMPRSGTTLTESIIGSHSDVFACGELETIPSITRMVNFNYKGILPYPFCMTQLSREQLIFMADRYLKELPTEALTKHSITDKLPHNFVNIGLIHILFPDAPIIHVMRDPRDTGLSNYQQNFGAKFSGMGYAFDLKKIARQINDYYRLMSHWRKSGVKMFEFWYEDLVADQEKVTRSILDFCGLRWDSRVMEFHQLQRSVRTASVSQVRKKMYSSSRKKWELYKDELEPMIQDFDTSIVRFYPG